MHIPHYPPRTHILGKFFEFNLLNSLNNYEKGIVIETFSQLEDLKYEFYAWRNYMIKILNINIVGYKAFSSTLLSYVDPIMINMIDLWVFLVKDIGVNSVIPQIQDLNKIILKKIKEGKWIRASYKSSFFNKDEYKNLKMFDVILCWENDWKESGKEVVELKNLVLIHESWK